MKEQQQIESTSKAELTAEQLAEHLPRLHQKESQPVSYEFSRHTVSLPSTVPEHVRLGQRESKVGESLSVQLKAVAFKRLKEVLNLHQRLSAMAQALLSCQLSYLLSMQHTQEQLKHAMECLRKHDVLAEEQVADLFDCERRNSSWNVMMDMSKSIGGKLAELIAEGAHTRLVHELGGLIEGLQVYKEEYLKLARVMAYIHEIELFITRELLCPESNRNSMQSQRATYKGPVISEILQEQQIETKHSQQYALRATLTREKWQEVMEAAGKIRKHIMEPFEKLSSFMQMVTQYLNLCARLPGRNGNGEAVKKLSVILDRIMNNVIQNMSDEEMDVVKWMIYKFPSVFYHEQELKVDSLQRSYSADEDSNQSRTPHILHFNTFPIHFMGIPCELYLTNSHLIIVKSNAPPQSYFPKAKFSQIREKAKRDKDIFKLAVIALDHTTRVEIVSHYMLYRGCVVHISGGMHSSGVYLEFKGLTVSQEDLILHKQICERPGCEVCKGQGLAKWSDSIAWSNMKTMKCILELTISYHTFLFSSLQNGTDVYLSPRLQQHYLYSGMPEKEVIPKDRLLSFRIVAIEYYCGNGEMQQYARNYLIELTLHSYDRIGVYNPLRVDHMSMNSESVSQIVQLTEDEIEELEEYITRVHPSLKSRQATHAFLLPFSESRQLFLSSSLEQEEATQLECMIINEYFNSFFKLPEFRAKPEIVVARLKLSQGMWELLVRGVNLNSPQLQNVEGEVIRRIDYKCPCSECVMGTYGHAIDKYWSYYNRYLAYPYCHGMEMEEKETNSKPVENHGSKSPEKDQKKKQRMAKFVEIMNGYASGAKYKRQPYCLLFANRIENEYISALDKIYGRETNFEQRNLFAVQQIQQHYNKIKHVQHLLYNYHISNPQLKINTKQFQLGNTVRKTRKVQSLNICFYSLPSLHEYYHQLNEASPVLETIFTEIQGCAIEPGVENHGFAVRLIVNIYTDTTCRHLKFIIGQRLGLDEGVIMHFMECFRLVILHKEELKPEKSSFSFSKLLGKKATSSILYGLHEVCLLHDHERVLDVLDRGRGFLIGIKKYIKIEMPLLTKLNPMPPSIKSYYILLQLELAQFWYKLNHSDIEICDELQNFLLKYISLLFSYLHAKMKEKKKERFVEKWKFKLSEKLLVKTGVLDSAIFQKYYGGLDPEVGIDPNIKNKDLRESQRLKNLENKLKKRQILQRLCEAQVQSDESPQQMLTKLLRLGYDQTNWTVQIEPVLFISSQQKQDHQHCLIFINREGFIIGVHSRFAFQVERKSKYSDDFACLKFGYETVDVEINGSVVTVAGKRGPREGSLGESCSFFCARAYCIYELIKFYKVYASLNPLEKLDMTKSKLKSKFSEEKRLQILEVRSRNYMHSNQQKSSLQDSQVSSRSSNLYKELGERRKTARQGEQLGLHKKEEERKK